MGWRDLLYFSKREKRALFVLLFIISISVVLLNMFGSVDRTVGITNASPSDSTLKKGNLSVAGTKEEAILSKKRTEKNVSTKTKYKPFSSQSSKYPTGTIIELNSADTTVLKKIPGIGSVFANRIVKYRNLLGGFFSVEQLSEVYGIDAERYQSLSAWFKIDTTLLLKVNVNDYPIDSLIRHPYLNYKQVKVIRQLRKQKGRLSGWDNLLLLEEFDEHDIMRLTPYISFD